MSVEAKKKFRFKGIKVGLTYSCPVGLDANPLDQLWTEKKLKEHCDGWGNLVEWLLGQEKHESGKLHYHMYLKYGDALDTKNVKFFDILGVHPNVIRAPGKGWIAYCAKEKEFVTNFYEADPWFAVWDMPVSDAIELLKRKRPKDVAIHGKAIRENLEASKKRKIARTTFDGPWPILKWNKKPSDYGDHGMATKALRMIGEPGIGKTQWLQWLALHTWGSYFYCKGSMEAMRHYNGEGCIIYDDIKVEKYPKAEWDDVFDCENGGVFAARYKDIVIPPGPKLWLQNEKVIVPDESGRIFLNDRRCTTRYMDANLRITQP